MDSETALSARADFTDPSSITIDGLRSSITYICRNDNTSLYGESRAIVGCQALSTSTNTHSLCIRISYKHKYFGTYMSSMDSKSGKKTLSSCTPDAFRLHVHAGASLKRLVKPIEEISAGQRSDVTEVALQLRFLGRFLADDVQESRVHVLC